MSRQYFQELCKVETLISAWEVVRSKRSMGGVDRQSVDAFDKNAERYVFELSQSLTNDTYIPEPYLEVHIPKKGGETRALGLPTVKDKVIQQAIKQLIEPDLEKIFLNTSYGYRPNKSAYKAIQRVKHTIDNEKKPWLANCDIDRFFDNIDHKLLLKLLKGKIYDDRINHLISLFIKMAKIQTDFGWKPIPTGVPQGNILSPLLSNVYLHELDVFIAQKKYGYVRYADDFIILTASQANAKIALAQIELFLHQKLNLSLNPEKHVHHVNQGFEYLGVWFKGSTTTVTVEKLNTIKQKLQEGFKLEGGEIHKDYIHRLHTLKYYYGKLLPQHLLEELDDIIAQNLVYHIRELLQQKRIERKSITPELIDKIVFLSQAYQEKQQRTLKDLVQKIRSRKDPYETETPELAKGTEAQKKIRKKKKEYQKKAAEVRELLISTPGVFLGKTHGKIVVRKGGKVLKKVPMKQVDNITVQSGGVTLSSDLIFNCSKNKIPVDFLHRDGKPFTKLINALKSNTGDG